MTYSTNSVYMSMHCSHITQGGPVTCICDNRMFSLADLLSELYVTIGDSKIHSNL